MPPTDRTSSVITEQLRRALGEAVIRIWSNLPQEVQDHLFNEAVASQGESIRSQLAVFLHDAGPPQPPRAPCVHDPNGQSLVILPRTLLLAGGLAVSSSPTSIATKCCA